MSASKQLGIDFSVQHVKDLLQAFVDARRESHATAQSLVSDARMVTQAAKTLQTAIGKASLANAKVSAKPSQNVNANMTATGLMINIKMAPIVVSMRGGSGPGSGGGSRGGGLSFPSGPRQRLIALQNMLPLAASQGNHAALADMAEQAARLQRRMRPKTTGDKLWEIATTSRFAAGGASPLVGKTLDAFGGRNSPMAKGLFGVSILATASIEAAKAIFKLTDEAKQFTLSQVQMQTTLGGTAKESAWLKGVGIAAGLSPEDMTGLAKNLQSSQSSPFGKMYAAQAGVFNLPGPLGNQDQAGQELKYIYWLRNKYQNDKSPGKADSLRSVRALGQEALLPAMRLGQPDWHQFVQAGRDSEQSPSKMLQAIKLQATEEKLKNAWGDLLSSLTQKGGVIPALDSFAVALNKITGWVNGLGTTNNPETRAHQGGAVGLGGLHPHLGNAPAFAKASPRAQSAYERSLHSQMSQSLALQTARVHHENERMMKMGSSQMQKDSMGIMMPGSYGRVTRGEAMPRALDTGFVLNKYLAAKALQLSSF
jgi:hypothetical protein